jgi:hypothetical protein
MFHSGDLVFVDQPDFLCVTPKRPAVVLSLHADVFEREYSWGRGVYRFAVLYDDTRLKEPWVLLSRLEARS